MRPGLPEPVNLCDAFLFDNRLSLPQSVKGLKPDCKISFAEGSSGRTQP
jgi:hypothetical protein